MMYQGIISYASGKGWCFVERDSDSSTIFVFPGDVENNRLLRVNDRVEFDVIPSRKFPGKVQAANVKYLGHLIARQVSDRMARP